jgi:hypothetical protein
MNPVGLRPEKGFAGDVQQRENPENYRPDFL